MKTICLLAIICLLLGFVSCNSRRSDNSKQGDQSKNGNGDIPFWAARGKRTDVLGGSRAADIPEDWSADFGENSPKERTWDTLIGSAGERDNGGDATGEVTIPVPLSWLVHERPLLLPASATKGTRSSRNLFGAWLKLLDKRNDASDGNNVSGSGGSGSHSQPEIPFWAARG